MTDYIRFICTTCGSDKAIYPNTPPLDDDIISCAGCEREIGPHKIIKDAMLAAGKDELSNLSYKIIGKRPTWKNG
ncbi:MAG: hypothetical protein CVT79_13095 [Alphaproteobacteria bacterium HGW-Alphaproteobacteria-18]|nr:MAG: hypothetical protein CVT79_13095 [Alphaproteobacteria bacterium HGW-Alphaproteobacteria-18]